MSRRAKTVAVLAFELCLVVAMVGSFIYFVRDSRDFLADKPVWGGETVAGQTPV